MFLGFANNNLSYDDDDDEHLPILVYSVIKPSIGLEFILNTLLSLGTFSTERELLLNDTLRGRFCNAKLIGEEDDPKSHQNYSNQVINIFVNTQLVFFPNGQRMIYAFIIHAVDLLDSIIINNKTIGHS